MSQLPLSDAPIPNFDHMPELAGYTNQPPAMYVGCPGKCGYLNLGFELDKSGRSIMRKHDRRVPLIVQRELYFDEELPELPCVYILSSGGPNVDGDRFTQIIQLAKGSMAFISTAASTKIAEMRHNYSGMAQEIYLDADSYLEFLPQPIIPHAHSRYISDTKIVANPSAAMFYSEIFMPGRKYYKEGEIFRYDVLSVCVHAERPDGESLFREKFVIEPQKDNVRNIGVMDFYDVFANVIVLAPLKKSEEIYAVNEPYIDKEKRLACGIGVLPNHAGLIFRCLGMEPGPVKNAVRQFCSTVRQVVKGRPLPREFAWR